jgi:UDP-glucose 4-epimerase
MTPFGADMLTCDMYAQLYTKLYGLKTVGLRYFNIFGKGQSEPLGVINKFVSLGLTNQPLTIIGDGEQTRNFIHVNDVATINVAAITERSGFRNYAGIVNVGSTQLKGPDGISAPALSINNLVRLINKLLPDPVTLTYQDANAVKRYGDVRRCNPDLGVLNQLLPELEMYSIEDGLRNLIKQLQV